MARLRLTLIVFITLVLLLLLVVVTTTVSDPSADNGGIPLIISSSLAITGGSTSFGCGGGRSRITLPVSFIILLLLLGNKLSTNLDLALAKAVGSSLLSSCTAMPLSTELSWSALAISL